MEEKKEAREERNREKLANEDWVMAEFYASWCPHCKRMQPIVEEFKKAIAFAGDIVVIHLGINDTDPRDWPNYRDSFVKDYLALIDSFRVANPKCHIIIARLTPIADRHPRFESGTRDWHGEIQQSIETIAKYAGVQLMDFHEPLYPYPYLLPDAVHPNVEGAGILAKTVYSAITGDFGGLHLSELYTDNMVLQHGEPLAIRGKANAGEKVTVSIAKQKLTAKAASNGDWAVTIQPLKAGGPYTLTVSAGKQKQTFTNWRSATLKETFQRRKRNSCSATLSKRKKTVCGFASGKKNGNLLMKGTNRPCRNGNVCNAAFVRKRLLCRCCPVVISASGAEWLP